MDHTERSNEENYHRYNTLSRPPPLPHQSPRRCQPPSPPRPEIRCLIHDDSREYDPEGGGHNLEPQRLKASWALNPRPLWMEVRADFAQFSEFTYTSRQTHNSRTKMVEAKAFFQLFKNARYFLEDHFRREGHLHCTTQMHGGNSG